MTDLKKYWKEIVIVVLLAGLVFGSNQYESLKEEYQLQLTENTKLKENTTIVEKITEVRPDGTRIVIDRNTDTQKEIDKQTEKVEVARVEKVSKKNYSISVHTPIQINPTLQDLSITAGIRLFHTPIWGEIGYQTKDNEITAGLRLEF